MKKNGLIPGILKPLRIVPIAKHRDPDRANTVFSRTTAGIGGRSACTNCQNREYGDAESVREQRPRHPVLEVPNKALSLALSLSLSSEISQDPGLRWTRMLSHAMKMECYDDRASSLDLRLVKDTPDRAFSQYSAFSDRISSAKSRSVSPGSYVLLRTATMPPDPMTSDYRCIHGPDLKQLKPGNKRDRNWT